MSNVLLRKVRKLNVARHIRGIQSRDFSIVASNCTGTLPYRFLDMPHTSPTINLFLFAPDYIKLASKLEYYLNEPLRFTQRSRYSKGRSTHAEHGEYPIGIIDDIEIHFMHYRNRQHAINAWVRRSARVNFDNLIFSFTDRDLCTPELMQRFNELPGRKILLTARPMPWLSCAVSVPAYRGQSEMGDAYTHYDTLKHVNFQALVDGPLTVPTDRLRQVKGSMRILKSATALVRSAG